MIEQFNQFKRKHFLLKKIQAPVDYTKGNISMKSQHE